MKFLDRFINEIKDLFDENVNFRLSVGVKFALIPTLSLFFSFVLYYLMLQVINSTIMSFDNSRDFIIKDVFQSFLEATLVDVAPWFLVFFLFSFIVGIVLANIILRPFRIISDYCDAKLENRATTYDPEFMTNLRLLSSFTEWFFNSVNIMIDSGKFSAVKIPEKYKRIHQPFFESNYFIYNLLIVFITSVVTALLIFYCNQEIYNGVMELVREFFVGKVELNRFLVNLQDAFSFVVMTTILFNVICYIAFFYHLYQKISTPAFGIFATLRSFLSGRFSTRVHLIGFPYMRNHTRKLNKFLDHLEKTYITKEIE